MLVHLPKLLSKSKFTSQVITTGLCNKFLFPRGLANHPESPIDRVENTPLWFTGRGPLETPMDTTTPRMNPPIPTLPMHPPVRVPIVSGLPCPIPTREVVEESEDPIPPPVKEGSEVGLQSEVSSSQDENESTPRSNQPSAGEITPEQPSDITSSDAVTINSSGNSSENPSIAEIGTPSSEQPSSSIDIPVASTTATLTSSLASAIISSVAGSSALSASTSGENRATPNMFGGKI